MLRRTDISSSRAARIWHLLTAVVVGAALALQFTVAIVSAGPAPVPSRILRQISYFPVESALLVCVSSALLALRPATVGLLHRVVRLDALLGITVSGLVYLVLLRPVVVLHGWARVADLGLHYLSPLLALAGWLVFGPRRWIDVRVVAAALIWPVLWAGWSLLHGAAAGFYPYPFIDVRELGYSRVTLNIAVVCVLLLGMELLGWLVDRRMLRVVPRGVALVGGRLVRPGVLRSRG